MGQMGGLGKRHRSSSLIRTLRYLQWYPGQKIKREDVFLFCDKRSCYLKKACLTQMESKHCMINIGKFMKKRISLMKKSDMFVLDSSNQ